eukprot:scaffold1559_cov193-Alexandrium_tamarense.AAC.1
MFGSSFGASLPSAPASSDNRSLNTSTRTVVRAIDNQATLTSSSTATPAPASAPAGGLPFSSFGVSNFGGGAKQQPSPFSSTGNSGRASFGVGTGGGATGSSGGGAGLAFAGFNTNTNFGTDLAPGLSRSTLSLSGGAAPAASTSAFAASATTGTPSFSSMMGSLSSGLNPKISDTSSGIGSKSSSNNPPSGFSSSGASNATKNISTSNALVASASNSIPSSRKNATSLENSCLSPNGRTFHSYRYDDVLGSHVIVSEFAPFGNNGADNNNSTSNNIEGSLKITTVLPPTMVAAINIDPVVGLICVDGTKDEGRRQQRQHRTRGEGEKPLSTLPWLCLYTRTSAFLLSIGYHAHDEDDETTSNISGNVLHVVEPFEKQLLNSPRGSSILRIRSAPYCNVMFHRCGSMALMLREGGGDDCDVDSVVGHVVMMYHGLPEALLGGGSSGRGVDMGGKYNPSTEGAVTTPLRFDYEDLVRGMEDTVDAENEAYSLTSLRREQGSASKSKKVVDFCFLYPSSDASGAFAATSILVLCNDGSVYGASPLIFDGTVLPRSIVVDAISQLDTEIEASSSFLSSLPPTPVATYEQESVEARTRQCKAAKRYFLDAFGIPDGGIASQQYGSFYVSASVVHPRPGSGGVSQALAWQPRLQGPLVVPRNSNVPMPPCACIAPFGGVAGGGIIDGFAVARASSSISPIHVEFGIVPGQGAVTLPRFQFESDGDCQLIDDSVRGTGLYVEHASISDDKSEFKESDGEGSLSLTTTNSSIGLCSIVADPLDDIMVHVMTKSRIVTVSTTAIAMTAKCFRSQMDGATTDESACMSSIKTKVWSSLEASSGDTELIGAGVSGDVHLGHILLASLSSGPSEVINITSTQCIHEATLQMQAKTEQLSSSADDDKTLEILRKVQPLHELLQPLIDQVCNGLSQMGKIVGGATLPKDAGPETLAVFIETQRSCEVNIIMPMEKMSSILTARRELLKGMYDLQLAELTRLSSILNEFKEKYEANLKRVVELEANASVLSSRSSAVLTASRDLQPQITDAEASYFKDLQRYETNCNKWDESVKQMQKDASTSCDAMSAGAIESGDVRCLVELPPERVDMCHKLLNGEKELLKKLEQKIKSSSDAVEKLSRAISGVDSSDAARLRLIGGEKENIKRVGQ